MNKIYLAVIFNDFYTDESGFYDSKIGNAEEIADFVNSYAKSFASENGIDTTPHDYDGDTIFQPIVKHSVYDNHILAEDINTNRVRVMVREVSCYASLK